MLAHALYGTKTENTDDVFSCNVTCDIMNENNGNFKPLLITKFNKRPDWIEWKKTVEIELDSLNKRKVF